MVVISHLTTALAVTIINANIAIIQHTLGLAVVVVLIRVMRTRHSAISWSVVTRHLHSSDWASLLQTDTSSTKAAGSRVASLLFVSFVGEVLVIVAGIATPIGLQNGPVRRAEYQSTGTSYVVDNSPMALATSPRDQFSYSRICGALDAIVCPGNGNDVNTSQIASSVFDVFASTPHGPFNMQFRNFYKGTGGYNYPMITSRLNTLQSFILRDDIFLTEGLIVDLSANPAVGLWNASLPSASDGGAWSTDVLWLEPITSCVNKNITIDFVLQNNPPDPIAALAPPKIRLTDHGGFVNLTTEYPLLNRDGQHINLYEHAYKAAVLTNNLTMQSLNTSRQESSVGRSYPFSDSRYSFTSLGQTTNVPLDSFIDYTVGELPTEVDVAALLTLCRGFGPGDIANMSNVAVHCSLFVGPPERTDEGDSRIPDDNSTWMQPLYACASTTRARLQKVYFSYNGSADLASIHITRENTNRPVLWAVEMNTLTIADVDIYWGQVDDSYEGHPSLSTLRSETLYLPAGASDYWGFLSPGQPNSAPATAWAHIHTENWPLAYADTVTDYSGFDSFALQNKWRSLVRSDPVSGPAQILNLIWTDIVANTLVGTDTSSSHISFAKNIPSVSYNLLYGIPAALLVLLWLPAFLMTILIFLTGSLKLPHIRHLLNLTSVGRVVMKDSRLEVIPGPDVDKKVESSHPLRLPSKGKDVAVASKTRDWANTVGSTRVALGSSWSVVQSERGSSVSGESPNSAPRTDRMVSNVLEKPLRHALADNALKSRPQKGREEESEGGDPQTR